MARRPERFADLDLGDPTLAKPAGRPRWTVGRVATDLAIIMVAVSFGLYSPSTGGCGMTGEFYVGSLGLAILGVRATWLVLKPLNVAAERWLDRLVESRSRRKPRPLDES